MELAVEYAHHIALTYKQASFCLKYGVLIGHLCRHDPDPDAWTRSSPTIFAARPAHTCDKPEAEGSMPLVERRILAQLSPASRFFLLTRFNATIAWLVTDSQVYPTRVRCRCSSSRYAAAELRHPASDRPAPHRALVTSFCDKCACFRDRSKTSRS